MKAKTALAFGTFDLIHPGHLFYLRKAKSLAEKLIVVVSRDENAARIKGSRPLNDEKDRLAVVQALEFVDQAVLGDKKDFLKPVEKFKPDVIALGYDQKPGKEELEEKLKERGLKIKIVLVKALKKETLKTSKIKEKVRLKY